MPLTMSQMRTDFASYVESLLQAHDAQFTVDTTERRELEQNVDRASRVKITGDPEKYCVIRDIGQASVLPASSFDAAGNAICFIGQRFDVRLFYEKNYTTSQGEFETIVYADRDASPGGLLDSIRGSREREVSSDSYMIGLPGEDAFVSIFRGTWDFGALGGQPELSHYLQFEVILIS